MTCVDLTQFFKLLPKQNICVQPISTIESSESNMAFFSVWLKCVLKPCKSLPKVSVKYKHNSGSSRDVGAFVCLNDSLVIVKWLKMSGTKTGLNE